MAIAAIFGNTKNLALNGTDSTISWAKPLDAQKPNNETMKNKQPPEEPIDISLPPNVTAWNVGIPFCWAQDYIENKKMSAFIWMGRLRLGMIFTNTFYAKNTIYIKHLSLKRSYKPI